jgi:putative heme-binding domain-containing protein
LHRKEGALALAAALESLPPPPPLARAALGLLAASGRRDPRLATVLEKAAGGTGIAPLGPDDIPGLAEAVRARGNVAAGKAVFQRETLACVHCHATDGTPGRIGPDLGALGTSQTIEFILGAILVPQREIKEGFTAHEIETRDGDLHQGYLRGETADDVALLDHLDNRVIRLRNDRIASRRVLGSLMPAGLADLLSRDELRDLTAYLASLGRRMPP